MFRSEILKELSHKTETLLFHVYENFDNFWELTRLVPTSFNFALSTGFETEFVKRCKKVVTKTWKKDTKNKGKQLLKMANWNKKNLLQGLVLVIKNSEKKSRIGIDNLWILYKSDITSCNSYDPMVSNRSNVGELMPETLKSIECQQYERTSIECGTINGHSTFWTFEKPDLYSDPFCTTLILFSCRPTVAERSKASILDRGWGRSWVRTPAKEIKSFFFCGVDRVELRSRNKRRFESIFFNLDWIWHHLQILYV